MRFGVIPKLRCQEAVRKLDVLRKNNVEKLRSTSIAHMLSALLDNIRNKRSTEDTATGPSIFECIGSVFSGIWTAINDFISCLATCWLVTCFGFGIAAFIFICLLFDKYCKCFSMCLCSRSSAGKVNNIALVEVEKIDENAPGYYFNSLGV
ncbi:unnamed protein product [Caenorhabditis brenneri]